jgi:hypothetical protein
MDKFIILIFNYNVYTHYVKQSSMPSNMDN